MKKILSVILSFSFIACAVVSAQAEDADIPKDGLMLWVKSDSGVTLDEDGYVQKWEDFSGKENHLMQEANASRRPEYFENSTGLRDKNPSVAFETGLNLVSEEIAYSGSSTMIIYYKSEVDTADRTIFSSSSHKGSATRVPGQIPFTLSNSGNDENGLNIVMANETGYDKYATGIPMTDESFINSMYVFDEDDKIASVYYNKSGDNAVIEKPEKVFTLKETPYYESFALGQKYDTSIKNRGFLGEVAEILIYDRALSVDELNQVNRYLKLKYDIPKNVAGLKLDESIAIMNIGDIFVPEAVSIFKLMDTEIEMPATDITVTSENREVILVEEDTALKAVGVGNSLITVSCSEGYSTKFIVLVPEVRVNSAQMTEDAENKTFKYGVTVESVAEVNSQDNALIVALYKDGILVGFEYDDELTDDLLEVEFTNVENMSDYTVSAVLVDSMQTLVPVSEEIEFTEIG